MKIAYPRPTVFAFYVKNPPPGMSDSIQFLSSSLNEGLIAKYKLKEIHVIVLETNSAVRLRTSDQNYINKWRIMIKDLFSEASRALGEDIVCELSEKESDAVKAFFRDQARKNIKSIVQLVIITFIYHSTFK